MSNVGVLDVLKELPRTFGNEVIAHGGGAITTTNGIIETANALKNIAGAIGAAGSGAIEEVGNLITGNKPFGKTFVDRFNNDYGWVQSKNIPRVKYLDEVLPQFDNGRHLTDKQKIHRKALRSVAEEATADLALMGALKGVKGAQIVGKADLWGNLAQAPLIYGGTLLEGYSELSDSQKRERLKQLIEQHNKYTSQNANRLSTPKVNNTTKEPAKNRYPWYHHAALGYGGGALAGGATGYLLSTLLNGDKATKVISTVGGGAVGSVLGRIIQKKMLDQK